MTSTATVLRYLCVLLAAAVGMGAAPASANGEPRGRLVDVGGQNFYLDCVGDGTPTVVIDAGAGGWSVYYRVVQDAVSESTRVCTYDRSGLGLSDRSPGPRTPPRTRTSSMMADELHHLLAASGEAGPFLLVGHSLGGYNVRIYQRRYGAEVAGMVLLESGHEEQWERLPAIWAAIEASIPQMRALPEAVRQGAVGLGELPPWPEELSPAVRQQYEQAILNPDVHATTAEEFAGARTSAGQVPHGPIGDLPLVIGSAARSFDVFADSGLPIDGANAIWAELQADFLNLSSSAVQMISATGTHDLYRSDPDFVVRVIQRGVELTRSAREAVDTQKPTLPDWIHRLPERSHAWADLALLEIERVTREMETEAFVERFAEDIEQIDVNRRVRVRGREAWRRQTDNLTGAHYWMERIHHGRVVLADNLVLAEIEWAGGVRGEALQGQDHDYRYAGLGLIEFDEEGRVQRQLLFADITTLNEHLRGEGPAWTLLGGR